MYSIEPFKILGVCVILSLAVELFNWLLVYRRSSFQHIKQDILVTTSKIDSLRASGKGSNDKQVKKMNASMEKLSAQLYFYRLTTMVVQLVLLGSTWRYLGAKYKGVPLAKLPFVPFKFFTRATHAGLEGDDLTDCAFSAVYLFCSMAVRGCVSKVINRSSSEVLINTGKNMFQKYAEEAAKTD